MDAASLGAGSSAVDPARNGEFGAYVDQLLASPAFTSSRRRSQLFSYLLDRTLAGEADQVTEYAIGLDVFQKPTSFDPRTEATVRAEMSRLRRALIDYYERSGCGDPWLIDLPKRGYALTITPQTPTPEKTFAVSIIQVAAPAPPRRAKLLWIAASLAGISLVAAVLLRYAVPARPPIGSVVVLPFQNLTGDAGNEYLADGITEQLTDSMAHIADLRVVARTSAFQFKGKGVDIRQIGRQVGADAVVEGSLRTLNGRLRLTVQVNRSGDGYHIASQTFDGAMPELERMQNDMVLPVLAALRPGSVLAKRRTTDPQAYDLFLRARALRGDGSVAAFQQAIAYLDQAIRIDPKYADAYAALAGIYSSGAANLGYEPLASAEKSKAAAASAIELDPFSAPAYAAQGFVDAMILLDWKRGEEELRNAVRLMPQNAGGHNALGLVLLAQGRFSEALTELQAAGKLDPLPAAPGATVGLGYYMARQYDQALQQLTRVRDLHPDVLAVHALVGQVWEAEGRFDKAMAEYQLCLPKSPDLVHSRIAHLLAVMGKAAEARKMLAELERPRPSETPASALDLAVIYGALGDRDRAFQLLARAYDTRTVWFLKVHPMLDPLRKDPRYDEFLKKAGL
jgi:TolB-like protein/Tfp pilus assembly protein PilF